MIHERDQARTGRLIPRSKGAWCAVLALVAATFVMGTGCDEEEAGRAFRDAATSSLQTGLKTALDGIVDGMFAVFELGTDDSSSSGSSSSTDTSSGSSGSSDSSSPS